MEEKAQVSRFSTSLVQEYPGERTVDISTDRCQFTGQRCSNLWLNLSDGFIGGGRKQNFLSGKGEGEVVEGTDGARLHYEAMRREGKEYALVVKLGTITENSAEVYSYAEEEMVEDTKLEEHLKHWKIDRRDLLKTGKSLMEMEYELNKDFAFEKILGEEKEAEVVRDLVGLRNLGNTCYINALLQLVSRLDEFKDYAESTKEIRQGLDLENLEWSKIVEGILDKKYVDTNISPFTFRKLFCSGHPDFKTHQQQDVVEFFQFLAEKFPASLGQLFQFNLANDLVVDGHGRREILTDTLLSLQVPSEHEAFCVKRPKLNESDPEESAVIQIPFPVCLAKSFAESEISDFRYKGQTAFSARTRSSFLTFPKYLFVAVRRYFFDSAWQPQKMDVAVQMPDMIDLAAFRASESLNLPPLDDDSSSSSPEVATLVDMGFPLDLAVKALRKASGSVEAAMDLLFSGALALQTPAVASAGANSGSSTRFRLVGFVSHLGKSVSTGHYVAHWRGEGEEWVLFNDEKVTKCKEPPMNFGYLYLYERID
jgi:ubiquitin carboxyl-terminal hydrolase 5/13